MKKLFTKILIILAIFFVIDLALGFVLDIAIKKSDNGRYYKARYSLEESNEEVIILGSSRAETNYAPFVVEEELGKSCWTTGRGGQILPFWHAMSKGIINRYTPEIIIVNVEPYFLEKKLSFVKAGFLRPFYRSHKEIRDILDRISPFEKLLLQSRTYAYNSSFYYLFRSFVLKDLDGRRVDNGWKPRIGNYPLEFKETRVMDYTRDLNEETVAYFERFIEEMSGSQVFVVISPDFEFNIVSTPTIEYLKKQDSFTFINLGENNELSKMNNRYKDPAHLNKEGAIVFTKQLCDEIRNR